MKHTPMQKTNRFMYLSLIAGVLLTTSCKKTGVLPETPNELSAAATEVQVLNGRLVFKDTASFGSTIRYLKSNGSGTLKQWDRDNGIISLEETYRSIDEKIAARESSDELSKPALNEMSVSERAENGTILWIPDRIFASILNSNGEYQVSDKIYRVTQQKVYSVHAANEILFQKNDLTNSAVEVTDVKYLLPASQQTGTANRSGDFDGWISVSTETDINGRYLPQTWDKRPTRLVATQWNTFWGIYSSHGARSQYEYKSKRWGWLDNDCSEIYVKCESAVRVLTGGTIYNAMKQDLRYDDDVVEVTLEFYINIASPIEVVWSNSLHRAIYKGATAQITM